MTWKKGVNGGEPRLRGCIGTLEARCLINGFKDYALTRYYCNTYARHLFTYSMSCCGFESLSPSPSVPYAKSLTLLGSNFKIFGYLSCLLQLSLCPAKILLTTQLHTLKESSFKLFGLLSCPFHSLYFCHSNVILSILKISFDRITFHFNPSYYTFIHQYLIFC